MFVCLFVRVVTSCTWWKHYTTRCDVTTRYFQRGPALTFSPSGLEIQKSGGWTKIPSVWSSPISYQKWHQSGKPIGGLRLRARVLKHSHQTVGESMQKKELRSTTFTICIKLGASRSTLPTGSRNFGNFFFFYCFRRF